MKRLTLILALLLSGLMIMTGCSNDQIVAPTEGPQFDQMMEQQTGHAYGGTDYSADKAKWDAFTIYQGEVPQSGNMTVPVYLSSSGNARGIHMVVDYDSGVATLLLASCYTGALYDANDPAFFGTVSPNELDFAGLGHNFTGSGILVYLVFSIQDPDGDPDVSLNESTDVRNDLNQSIGWTQTVIKLGN